MSFTTAIAVNLLHLVGIMGKYALPRNLFCSVAPSAVEGCSLSFGTFSEPWFHWLQLSWISDAESIRQPLLIYLAQLIVVRFWIWCKAYTSKAGTATVNAGCMCTQICSHYSECSLHSAKEEDRFQCMKIICWFWQIYGNKLERSNNLQVTFKCLNLTKSQDRPTFEKKSNEIDG